MPYTKYHDPWASDPDTSTPITAAALDHIEAGIATAQSTADAAIPKAISGVATDKVPVYNGTNWVAQKIVNAQIDAAAAIAHSKILVPAASVTKAALQTISTGTLTYVVFDQERFDTDAIWDVGDGSKLVCKTAGKYLITGGVGFDANATGERQVGIRLNAATDLAVTGTPTGHASVAWYEQVTTIYDLAVNDYVRLYVYQNSGGNLNVLKAGAYSPVFSMAKVA